MAGPATSSVFDQSKVSSVAADPGTSDCAYCLECDHKRASAFKAKLPTKRVRIQVAPSNTSNRRGWVAYQQAKCGNLEYNIYDPGWIMWAASHIHYELDPRSSIWADGLAATPPPAAPKGYKYGCCLLEAKWSQPIPAQALYVNRRTFVSTRNKKWWLRIAYQRYKDKQVISNLWRLRRLKRRKRPISFATFAGRRWAMAFATATAQLAAYSAFCRNPETAFTRYIVICGEKRFVRTYFAAIARGPVQVVHSPMAGANWRT